MINKSDKSVISHKSVEQCSRAGVFPVFPVALALCPFFLRSFCAFLNEMGGDDLGRMNRDEPLRKKV